MVGLVFREKYYQMSLNIKRKVQFILGDSSKLKAAFDFYPSWFFHLYLQQLYIGNGD